MNNKKLLVIIDSVEFAKTALLHAKTKAIKENKSIDIAAFDYEETGNILFSLEPQQQLKIQQSKLSELQVSLMPLIDEVLGECEYDFQTLWHENPVEWLNEQVNVQSYEVVIKTRHIDEHQQFNDLDWQLIRFSPIPLYLAADNKWRNTSNVLAALDLGSKDDAKCALNEVIIEQAKRYAASEKCKLHTCYTVHVSPLLRDLGIVFSDEQVVNAFDKLPEKQKDLILSHNIKEQLEIKAGIAEQVIPSLAAKYDANLVIIGAVKRSSIKSKLIGNTAEKVMRLLKTDLLILPPV
ncbi:universal stress protein [Pseudoalteromonas sp. MMG010]|uniref:universal stress protein n=1 Tax=Pseudoalteromonas sp. MMG010 TaxID=2822685 RepID=UPI001B3A3BA2|nr:universal stress protein [Pseudoalteromonas sp. MMG010]MBQ4833240.1 universal stress protein [Pseudoalteromonas sp. MMG010]